MIGLTTAERCAFILRQTLLKKPPLVPEIRLQLADEALPLWQATETELTKADLPLPFWAFAWAGGQGLARYVLDNPALVQGQTVLDFASGSGLVAIAAAKAGAEEVWANDVDDFALAAITMNAAANKVALSPLAEDLTVATPGDTAPRFWPVILAGDVCYEQPMAENALKWLRKQAAKGATVLLADPGRTYAPTENIIEQATYKVPTSRELEDSESKQTRILQILG